MAQASKPTTIRVQGVPEHFNTVWHKAVADGKFQDQGLDVQFTEQSLGTGAMTKALAGNETDVAVLLTEGCVKDIAKGAAHRIVGAFTESPLTWGIHVAAHSRFNEVDDLKDAVFGISRNGSGSHLMAIVLALTRGWDVASLKFSVVGNMQGAREALRDGKADVYLWEKLTTKWLVELGEFRRVGDIVTPWPCFVVTARCAFIEEHGGALERMMAVVKQVAQAFMQDHAATVPYIADKCNLAPADVQSWLEGTRWSCECSVRASVLEKVVATLVKAAVLSPEEARSATPASLVSKLTTVSAEMPSGMYNWRVQSILTALEKRGKGPSSALTVADLTSLGHLDQYHYRGTLACDECAHVLGLDASRHVLDVGSGIGGPARYLAHTTGCKVTGVELQEDLVNAGASLTNRCAEVKELVTFHCGDITAIDLPQGHFDHFISLLVFLHIPARDKLFRACHSAVKPGGTFLIEDFFQISPFTPEEQAALKDVVSATSVVPLAQYRADLERAGFTDIVFHPLTTEWTQWCTARAQGYQANKEQAVAQYGEAVFASRSQFYHAVDSLFRGGNLGGVRITGRRRGALEQSLVRGLLAASAHDAGPASNGPVVLESGETQAEVLARSAAAGEHASSPQPARNAHDSDGQAGAVGSGGEAWMQQPNFPSGAHDSLQCHFFPAAGVSGGVSVSWRLFHTNSLQRHLLWLHDHRTNRTLSLVDSAQPLEVSRGDGDSLVFKGSTFEYVEGRGEGHVTVWKEAAAAAAGEGGGQGGREEEPLLRLSFRFGVGSVVAAAVPAQRDAVNYRVGMEGKLVYDGASLAVCGFSKRYYGDYPPHWGYRFLCGPMHVPGPNAHTVWVWTADATFGDSKYNYFRVRRGNDAPIVESNPEDSYQQANLARGVLQGNPAELRVATVGGGDWVVTRLESSAMASKMRERLCSARLEVGGVAFQGLCVNEVCFGTLA